MNLRRVLTRVVLIGLLSGGFSEEALRSSGMIDVYRDIADLLEHYEESPLAQSTTDSAS